MQCKQQQAVLGHERGVNVSLPGGVTSIDHAFRLPLDWGFDEKKGDEAAGGRGDEEERFVEVFARYRRDPDRLLRL